MKHLDMLGQPCPIPVVSARRALQAGEHCVTVDVDNEVAVQNLQKMADGEGYQFDVRQQAASCWRVTIGGETAASAPQRNDPAAEGMTVLIGREHMGGGADELGALLMKGFLFSLTELPAPPAALIFLNGGAKLTTDGAAGVADLRTLAEKGTKVYTCGTCANFYGITDQLAVGQITDMMHIARLLAEASHVVTL